MVANRLLADGWVTEDKTAAVRSGRREGETSVFTGWLRLAGGRALTDCAKATTSAKGRLVIGLMGATPDIGCMLNELHLKRKSSVARRARVSFAQERRSTARPASNQIVLLTCDVYFQKRSERFPFSWRRRLG